MSPAIGRLVRSFAIASIVAVSAFLTPTGVVHGQGAFVPAPLYQQLKAFVLTGGSADVSNLVLKRDRVDMTFTGTFYFMAPVEGHVTGAVFIGQGTVHADVPPSPSDFEKDNLHRMIGVDAVDSDFKTVVMRMTDDTFDVITHDSRPHEGANVDAQKLALEFEPRLLHDTGLNLSARVTTSIMNGETPGVFFAEFDGGKRNRFAFAMDYQNRIPTGTFGINGGEKGLFFAYDSGYYTNQVWMAFYAQSDYGHTVAYSDMNDLINVTHYDMTVDAREPSSRLGLVAKMDVTARAGNVRAVPFRIGEELGTFEETRLKKQMHLKAASVGGQPVPAVQEDWEGGFTVFLPKPLQSGDKATIEVSLEGNYLQTFPPLPECFFLISNDVWYPRHADLGRATFDFTFLHQKRHIVVAGGLRTSDAPDADGKGTMVTKFKQDQPVPLVDFAVGAFERTVETLKWENGDPPIPIEFDGLSKAIAKTNPEFMEGELNNAVRFFASYFGRYPYSTLTAAAHPYGFGQGFPSMLFLYAFADNRAQSPLANAHAYAFLSHETAHQWWGGVVAWRSYRDQWLSEGFAEYSAMLFAKARLGADDKTHGFTELVRVAHDSVHEAPKTATGSGKGRLTDMGPIILGRRLYTTKSTDAYQTLIYNKGAMVLRMLHFLLSNPSNGDDKEFFAMMRDFVEKHRNGSASTDDFAAVASEHFAQSPLGQKYGLTDLNWFFQQWVYQTSLPTYTVDYNMKDNGDGTFAATGTVHQDNAPANWVMPLPMVFTLASNQVARTTVLAKGASNAFQFTLRLPSKPVKVELDPASWILSEKTTLR